MSPWLNRLADALRPLRRARAPGKGPSEAAFRLMYERFRELLALNDATLQLYADIEDRLAAREPFALDATLQRVRKAGMDVFFMVKNLNQIAGGRYAALYEALQGIAGRLDAELLRVRGAVSGPLVVTIEALRAADTPLAGAKMANLGEVRAALGLPVPPGFVITTAAFARFMADNELWERAERLESLLATHGDEAVAEACAEVRQALLAAPIPDDVLRAIDGAYEDAFGGADVPVALRSSAVGEDDAGSSHAGIYDTRLHVPRAGLHAAWREVVASSFSPVAVAYRFARGLTAGESAMAVGCLRMLEPRVAGIMFSRRPEMPEAVDVVISATRGVAAGVAAGTEGAAIWVGAPAGPFAGPAGLLDAADLGRLAALARVLEQHFGAPQDVEWALVGDGEPVVLQTRPLVSLGPPAAEPSLDGGIVLAQGGATACPGVASGPVVPVRTDSELRSFPSGGVLLARHSSSAFMPVMSRCAAIVTAVGSPTGHMSILAREFGVPAVVGMAGAEDALQAGRIVTVDATRCRVLEGALAGARHASPAPPRADTPAVQALRRIAALVTPLHLTDPSSPDFAPAACRSLHDVTRFVHEKVFEVMFHFGDVAASDRHHSYKLDASLPIVIRVFDVGGGLAEESYPAGTVRPEDIVSPPMRAFLDGMMDERLSWRQPRPVSVSGFLSVLGESLAGPPAQAQAVGRLSYAIVSDRYMNFSTKAGYHFSTVDSYCGRSQNKNYIHFRFAGGAADERRRTRRVRFLLHVLEALEFSVSSRGDVLHARFDKYAQGAVLARLADLGRITMCARQLDMMMATDASPDFYAEAYLAGRFDVF